MIKILKFSIIFFIMFIVYPEFSSAKYEWRPFHPNDITWTLKKHNIWADEHTYTLKGIWIRVGEKETEGDWNAFFGRIKKGVHYRYEISVACTYKPKELNFNEEINLVLNSKYDNNTLRAGTTYIWHVRVSGNAGYDPWLWPSKAIASDVSKWWFSGEAFQSHNISLASFDFPLPLSFHALTEVQRKSIRTEESEAILPPCPNMYYPPRVKSPNPDALLEGNRLHMSFEVDCRYNDYRSNYFEVELQWAEPGLEKGANTDFRSENGNFRPYPNQPTIVLDMRPAANQYEYKSWGSGHLDLPIERRYRLKVRAQIAGELNHAPNVVWTNWSEWKYFVIGPLKPLGGEALKNIPDTGGQQGIDKEDFSPALVGSKRSYRQGERVVFAIKQDSGKMPAVEFFDGQRWVTPPSRGADLHKMGAGPQTRYILQPSAPGKYRLRLGKVYSEPVEVKAAIGTKTAVQAGPAETPASDAVKKSAVPLTPKGAPKLSLSKHTYTGKAKVKLKVKADKAFTVEYVLEKKISGKYKPVDESKKPEFNVSAPGKYQVRARYEKGKFGTPVAFTVNPKQAISTAPAKDEPTAKDNISKKKTMMKKSQ